MLALLRETSKQADRLKECIAAAKPDTDRPPYASSYTEGYHDAFDEVSERLEALKGGLR